MDVIDKIQNFASLNELKKAILEDKTSTDILAKRYCVRFVMLNNFNDYKELYKWLCSEKIKNINIEDLADGPDLGITSDRLRKAVLDCEESAVFTPFSELVRFYPEDKFRGFFNDIILTENKPGQNIRIYLPIIGLHNRFTDFLKNFGRIQESAPIWQLYSINDNVQVYVTNIKVEQLPKMIDAKIISTMGEWLRFWKTMAPVEKIICNARFIRTQHKYSKPDSIFSFHIIENAHAYLTDFLGLHIPLQYNKSEDQQWNNLAKAILYNNSESFYFPKFVADYLQVSTIDWKILIQKWTDKGSTEFDRWLLKNLTLYSDLLISYPYLKICIAETSKLSSPQYLLNHIATRIFHMFTPAEVSKYSSERLNIMNHFRDLFRSEVPLQVQKEIQDEMIAIVQHDNQFSNIKKFCTGIFDFEKPMYMAWYSLRSENDFGIKDIKKLYPSLASYMSCEEGMTDVPNQNLISYMAEYRKAKIADKFSDVLKEQIGQLNANKDTFYAWYYTIEDEHELLASVDVDYVYWIDGLGVEFMPLILNILNNSQFTVTQACYARTGLPSDTNLNRFIVDNIKNFKIESLDNLAHGEIYKRFDTLIKEINEVEKIIEKIISDRGSSYCSIAIVSDHGLSAMSRLVDSIKLSKDTKHEGRYIKLKDIDHDDDLNYILCKNDIDENHYHVALRHASLGNKPIHEVHGGATPEEVMVPFIVISNNPNAKKLDFSIKVISDKVPVSNPILLVDIMPVPSSVNVLINGQTYAMQKKLRWELNLDFLHEGIYKVIIVPEKGCPFSSQINIYGLGGDNVNPFDDF